MIDSILDLDIALEYLETTIHHHTRWWIYLSLCLPELARCSIISLAIEIECLLIGDIDDTVRIVFTISDEFIDTYAFGLSLHGDEVELSGEIEWSDSLLGCLRDDDMDIVLLACTLETRGEIHRVTEDCIVEPIMGTDIAYHDLTPRYTHTEVYRLHPMLHEVSIELRKSLTHQYRCICSTHCMISI